MVRDDDTQGVAALLREDDPMTKNAFDFVPELPKAARGRVYTRTVADDGLDALDGQPVGTGLSLTVSAEDAGKLRGLYARAASQRGKKVATRYADGVLYVAYATK